MVQYILAHIAMMRVLRLSATQFNWDIYRAVSNIEDQAFANLLSNAYPNSGTVSARII